ncbi:hypothetical protein FGO68_gene4139 [Halteria grandinella]|uniref:Uncharacterized protein n=1 Tax=Halteria grandinella TaxID=5974 RepID=A0A8J8NZL9_HALGN|nr:hypothetical protein FGO68_gene4139 [Halteria grandinella]
MFFDSLDKIDDLPQSLTILSSNNVITFDRAKQILNKNPFIKELRIGAQAHQAVQLLGKFKQAKLNFFYIRKEFFSFKHCYAYLHPECKQFGIPGSEPDHVLYELLFNRIDDKLKMLQPYLTAIGRYDNENIKSLANAPPELMEQLSTFKEFENCLRQAKLEQTNQFDLVFNDQIALSTDYEYLRIIVSAYDEVFNLGADIDKTVTILKGMTQKQRKTIKRDRFFHHCRHNWVYPIMNEDYRQN